MTVRSRRFGFLVSTVSTAQVIYTVPADRTAIIKQLTARSTAVVAQDVTFYVDPATSTDNYTLEKVIGLAAGDAVSLNERFHVLHEGDAVGVVFGGLLGNASVSGALLLGDPA